MNVTLEDVIALLKEMEQDKTKMALIVGDNVYKQYALIGAVEGVRACIKKLENHYGREMYTYPQA